MKVLVTIEILSYFIHNDKCSNDSLIGVENTLNEMKIFFVRIKKKIFRKM